MRIPPAYLRGIKQSLSFYPRSYATVTRDPAEVVAENIEKVMENTAQTIRSFEKLVEQRRQELKQK